MASTRSSQALTKRPLDAALMPPPPPPKRIKRPVKVLDEDDYTDALSHIIARDFFPGLLETESQQDYLNALDSQDPEWIATAGRKLTEVMTPGPDGRRLRGRRGTSMISASELHGRGGETPKMWQGDTPGPVISTVTEAPLASEKPEIDTNLGLGAFQSKYTSEDNESFYKLLDKQNVKKSEKYPWMWADNKIPAARQIAHRKREGSLLANQASQAQVDGKGVVKLHSSDARKAMPDSWRSRPDNSLMFEPTSIEDTLQTIQQKAEETSLAPPKAVVYDNTRLTTSSTMSNPNEPPIPPSPSLSAVQDAIAGRPRPSASEVAFNGAATPRVNGYAFVDPEPRLAAPAPTSSWETSDLLGNGDATPNPFKIEGGSKREVLHHRMVDKVARGKRTVGKRESELKTPVPRFASSPRLGTGEMTPAAQRLLGKIGGGGKTPSVWEGKRRQSVRRSGLRDVSTPVAKPTTG